MGKRGPKYVEFSELLWPGLSLSPLPIDPPNDKYTRVSALIQDFVFPSLLY